MRREDGGGQAQWAAPTATILSSTPLAPGFSLWIGRFLVIWPARRAAQPNQQARGT